MPHTLVTGANSFVAAHILDQLIASRHRVTGSVRRAAVGPALLEAHPEWKPSLDFVVIEDYAAEGAWDTILQKHNFDYIIHVAAPLLDNPANTDYDRDYLRPSVDGNLSLLRSAVVHAKNLKSIAITGSMNAMTMGNPDDLKAQVFTNDSWSKIMPSQAREAQTPYLSYCSSKKEAELAVWDFVKKENPSFGITVFLPALIFGPPIQPVKSVKALNYSASVFYKLFNGTYTEVPDTHTLLFPSYIDVRDLATAHIRALTTPVSRNKRYLVGGKALSASLIVATLRKLSKMLKEDGGLPELKGRLPEDTGKDKGVTLVRMRPEEGNRDLSMQLRSEEETFGDAARKILELEKLED